MTFSPQGVGARRPVLGSIFRGGWTSSHSPGGDRGDCRRGVAARLVGGDVVAVSGELGAGKTTFVRGAARALGVETSRSRAPRSRSVTATNVTATGRLHPVAHLDLYRLAGIDPEEWGDLEPYFDGTIAFVEWPEHGGNWLPPARIAVTLSHVDPSRRRISITDADDSRF